MLNFLYKRIFFITVIFLVFFYCARVSAAEIIDTDKDGLSDDMEQQIGTDLNNPDTDGDGFADGTEVAYGYNPLVGNKDHNVKREVKVNLDNQTLQYFFNGVEIGQMYVSSGIRGKDTPTGEFSIMKKIPVYRYVGPGYNLPNAKWNLEFKKGFYLHGAYWHNQFGIRPMSHGCVNIAYKDVEKLYKFMQIGDKVEITGKTPTKKLKIATAK